MAQIHFRMFREDILTGLRLKPKQFFYIGGKKQNHIRSGFAAVTYDGLRFPIDIIPGHCTDIDFRPTGSSDQKEGTAETGVLTPVIKLIGLALIDVSHSLRIFGYPFGDSCDFLLSVDSPGSALFFRQDNFAPGTDNQPGIFHQTGEDPSANADDFFDRLGRNPITVVIADFA